MHPTRDPPSHPRSSYDPNLRRITMAPDATTYDRAHELAHQIQDRHQTLRWRLRQAVPPWVPYLNRILTVLVELEANRMALCALHHAGLTTHATTAAGRNCTRFYLRQLFFL